MSHKAKVKILNFLLIFWNYDKFSKFLSFFLSSEIYGNLWWSMVKYDKIWLILVTNDKFW